MAQVFFTPAGYAQLAATTTSSRVAIPGTPTCVKVTNLGRLPVAVLFGNSSVVVTEATGHIILPGQFEFLAPAAFAAAIVIGNPSGSFNVPVYFSAGA